MAQQTVNLGAAAGDGTGDPLRSGGDKINDNFDELYAAVALNTAKETNATHTGDVTGSGVLTIADEAVTLAKMADMASSSLIYRRTAGTGPPEVNTLAQLKTDLAVSSLQTYAGTVDLTAGVVTQKITTVTSYPYSIMLCDASDNLITHTLQTELTTSGGFYVLNIYSVDDMVGVKVRIVY